MTNYKLIANWDGILRINDDGGSTSIPNGGTGWAEYQAWLAGNTPEPADVPIDDPGDVARTGARAWFTTNPATVQIFTLGVAELETEMSAHVASLFPTASAALRNKEVKLRMAELMVIRMLVKRELLG